MVIFPQTLPALPWRSLLLIMALFNGSAIGAAESTDNPFAARVQVATNYYAISGSNGWELHQSIAQARPWKTNGIFDARTEWNMQWSFRMTRGDDGVRLERATIETKVVVTLPRWSASSNAPPELLARWRQYMAALWTHELGHVNLARQATAEMQQQAAALGVHARSHELRSAVDRAGQQVLDKYHRQERDYDQRTGHGVTQGAQIRW